MKRQCKKTRFYFTLLTTSLLLGPLASFSSFSMAQSNEDPLSYEGILSELSSNVYDSRAASTDPFAHVLMHGGVALSTTYLNLNLPSGVAGSGFLSGMEANMGIDLLSKVWMAEGSVRSYGTESFSDTTRVSLREFDLKVVYRKALSRHMMTSFGLGVAARYLKVQNSSVLGGEIEQTTPASIFSAGLHTFISRSLSLGLVGSMRNPLISETVEKLAFDAGLRVDGHF